MIQTLYGFVSTIQYSNRVTKTGGRVGVQAFSITNLTFFTVPNVSKWFRMANLTSRLCRVVCWGPVSYAADILGVIWYAHLSPFWNCHWYDIHASLQSHTIGSIVIPYLTSYIIQWILFGPYQDHKCASNFFAIYNMKHIISTNIINFCNPTKSDASGRSCLSCISFMSSLLRASAVRWCPKQQPKMVVKPVVNNGIFTVSIGAGWWLSYYL